MHALRSEVRGRAGHELAMATLNGEAIEAVAVELHAREFRQEETAEVNLLRVELVHQAGASFRRGEESEASLHSVQSLHSLLSIHCGHSLRFIQMEWIECME